MTDVLLVSLGATAGLRAADHELAASLRRAGAAVECVTAARPREVRTFAATDLAWALAARRAARAGLAAYSPRAVLYSTTTAALLWPRPGALRFDALAADTRPGRHGVWQRPVEARRLKRAPLLVPWSDGARGASSGSKAVTVPFAVEASGTSGGERDVAALTYGANWRKKGLDRVLAAWRELAAAGADVAREPELVVAGVDAAHVANAWAAGGGAGPLPASVRVTGPLAPAEYRALLRRARVFVTAPRREDYGIAQLEALADGCALVTSAAPGPYAALPLARVLDPHFVVEDGAGARALASALRAALAATDPARVSASRGQAGVEGHSASCAPYAVRAAEALAPFSRAAVDRDVAEELLPRLLG